MYFNLNYKCHLSVRFSPSGLKLQIASLLLILLFIGIKSDARAQVAPKLSISPPKVDIVVQPDQIQQVDLTITNDSEVALPIKVVVVDFAPRDDRGNVDFERSIPGHSGVKAVKVNPEDMVLDPGQSRKVIASIYFHKNTELASYFAAVMFEPTLPPNYYKSDAQAKIVPWVASLFMMQVGDLPELDKSAIKINSIETPKVIFGTHIPVKVRMTNTTKYHLKPDTTIILKGPFGRKNSLKIEAPTIMPEMSREITARLGSTDPFGVYKGQADILLGGLRKSVASNICLFLTWKGIGALIVILVCLHFLFNRRRPTRLHRAWAVLWGKKKDVSP